LPFARQLTADSDAAAAVCVRLYSTSCALTMSLTAADRKPGVFVSPHCAICDRAGNIFVTEHGNNSIRRISPNLSVTTVAGLGTAGFANGGKDVAMFAYPSGVTVAPDGNLVVADTGNHRIRGIRLNSAATNATTNSFLVMDLKPMLTIYGVAGNTYRIDYSEELMPSQWIPLTNVTLAGSSYTWVDPRSDGGRKRLYRAVRQ
jgi:DNA-binding beta-propeller fold protein YncE